MADRQGLKPRIPIESFQRLRNVHFARKRLPGSEPVLTDCRRPLVRKPYRTIKRIDGKTLHVNGQFRTAYALQTARKQFAGLGIKRKIQPPYDAFPVRNRNVSAVGQPCNRTEISRSGDIGTRNFVDLIETPAKARPRKRGECARGGQCKRGAFQHLKQPSSPPRRRHPPSRPVHPCD